MAVVNRDEASQAESLRNLYFTRTVVQLLWAGVVLGTATKNPHLAAGLLLAYPLWDVACTVYDLRVFGSTDSGQSITRYINIALGVLAAVGIGLTVSRSPQQAVVVFGAWALAAGLAQLAVGLARRRALGGGQWAMILSGVQSAAAGVAFIAGGLHDKTHIKDLGGYAVLGGVYFLVAGILLHRKLPHLRSISRSAIV